MGIDDLVLRIKIPSTNPAIFSSTNDQVLTGTLVFQKHSLNAILLVLVPNILLN
jgi:hypothetical protein